MAKYRKKPDIIEAFRYGSDPTPQWALEALKDGRLFFDECGDISYIGIDELYIRTDEGTYHVSMWDYIVKGTHGELYPVNCDIFEETHDVVKNEEATS